MHDVTLAVRGGLVVTAGGSARADVLVRGDRIAAIGSIGPADHEIDARGLLVMPGVVDIHTHLDTQTPAGLRSADDWRSGTRAAASGGVTTVVDYIRQSPTETLADVVVRHRARADPDALIDFGFHLVPHEYSAATLAELPKLITEGCPSVKIFMSKVPLDEMARAMDVLAHSGGVAMVHAEDPVQRDAAYARLRSEGHFDARSWSDARPRSGEIAAVAQAIHLCELTRCPTYLVHLSCAESVELARSAKARGLPIGAETRPCYLLETDVRYGDPTPRHLMFTGYPPLRRAEDVEALWRGVQDGTIDGIGSDHLSWTIEQKLVGDNDLDQLPVGLPALETELAALFSAGVVTGRIGAERLVEVMATAPARVAGLLPRKGTIAVGSDADLVLLDPVRRTVIHGTEMHGGAGHEPLEGLSCVGWPVATISRGDVIASDGKLAETPGRGRYLARPALEGDTRSLWPSGSPRRNRGG